MSDEEKCLAVLALMDLYGGWVDMSSTLLGPVEDNNPNWLAYHARAARRTDARSYIDNPKQRWAMAWMPAFWDTIQEIGYE